MAAGHVSENAQKKESKQELISALNQKTQRDDQTSATLEPETAGLTKDSASLPFTKEISGNFGSV